MRTVIEVSEEDLALEIRSRLEEEGGFEVVATLESSPGGGDSLAVLSPDVVFLGVDGPTEGLERISPLRAANPHLLIVACAKHLAGAEVVELLRAGATDCYHPGICGEDFLDLASRLRQRVRGGQKLPPAEPRGRTVGFLSLKPGAGATTLASQTAHALRRQSGKRVLLVDLNLYSGTLGMGSEQPDGALDVVSALEQLPRLQSGGGWAHRTILQHGLRILPAPSLPYPDDPALLVESLLSLIALARKEFDWVIVDLPQAAAAGTLKLALALDQVIAVTTPELPCLHLARRRLEEFFRFGLTEPQLRVAANRTGRRDLVSKEGLVSVLGRKVRWNIPNDYMALHAAGERGLSGESALAGAIRKIALSLDSTERPQPNPPDTRNTLLSAPVRAMVAHAN
ncbi:MAG: hypothetical protein HY821_04320 [Acidobacteria bacterium]|nr:hypothetical protein [Acidobacteriota bacterium]